LLVNDLSLKGVEYEKSGVPTLFYNPSGWTQMGNLLIFDWPPPVLVFLGVLGLGVVADLNCIEITHAHAIFPFSKL